MKIISKCKVILSKATPFLICYFIVLMVLIAILGLVLYTPPFSFTLLFKGYIPLIAILIFVGILIKMTHTSVLYKMPNCQIVGLNGRTGEFHTIGGNKRFPRQHLFLIQSLHSKDPEIRNDSIQKLAELGKDALPAIFYHCREEGVSYREAILTAIDKAHPEGLMAALIEALEDEEIDEHSCWQICNVIRDMGKNGSPAIPVLGKVMKRNYIFGKVSDALISIGPSSVPELVKIADDQTLDQEVRRTAIWVLGSCFWNGNGTDEQFLMAKDCLMRVAGDTNEPEELRASSQNAFTRIDQERIK